MSQDRSGDTRADLFPIPRGTNASWPSGHRLTAGHTRVVDTFPDLLTQLPAHTKVFVYLPMRLENCQCGYKPQSPHKRRRGGCADVAVGVSGPTISTTTSDQLLHVNWLKSSRAQGGCGTTPPSPACPRPSGVARFYGVTSGANHVTGDLSPTFRRARGGRGGGASRGEGRVAQRTRSI